MWVSFLITLSQLYFVFWKVSGVPPLFSIKFSFYFCDSLKLLFSNYILHKIVLSRVIESKSRYFKFEKIVGGIDSRVIELFLDNFISGQHLRMGD